MSVYGFPIFRTVPAIRYADDSVAHMASDEVKNWPSDGSELVVGNAL